MRPTDELLTQLRREKIATARQMNQEQKLRAGPELFDLARELALTGVRAQYPAAQEVEIQQLLRQRLARQPRQETNL